MNPADYSGGDYIRFICGSCEDFRVIAAPPGLKDSDEKPIRSVPCPYCGTDEKRRDLFTKRALIPEIRVSDLTEEEQELFRDWRIRGHHELDCLRWIEGRRYVPEKDPEFMADCNKRLAEWRQARDEQHEKWCRDHPSWSSAKTPQMPRLHPCVKCGAACDEQTLFCPICWEKHQKAKGRL